LGLVIPIPVGLVILNPLKFRREHESTPRISPQQAMAEVHDGLAGRGEILLRNPWWQRSEDCSPLFSLHPKPARVGDFVAVAGFPETGKRALCQFLGH
jgi:hypothetical protein